MGSSVSCVVTSLPARYLKCSVNAEWEYVRQGHFYGSYCVRPLRIYGVSESAFPEWAFDFLGHLPDNLPGLKCQFEWVHGSTC